jgi:uridine kinase|tara:strand:+ start:458 stop:781 length:324 start_codon:yes stop_codon:yes gene_type:complete
MDSYISEYNSNLFKAKDAVLNGKNVILCGPEMSGKTTIQSELKEELKNYEIFYGIQDYHYRNTTNGKHYANKKFWIEEQEKNKSLISNVLEDYEYIETVLKFNIQSE